MHDSTTQDRLVWHHTGQNVVCHPRILWRPSQTTGERDMLRSCQLNHCKP